jgi:hypothetical protein
MNADTESNQEKAEANRKANQDSLARMESQIGSLVAKMEAERKTDWEEIRAGQEQMASLVSRIEDNQAKTEINLNEIREEIES